LDGQKIEHGASQPPGGAAERLFLLAVADLEKRSRLWQISQAALREQAKLWTETRSSLSPRLIILTIRRLLEQLRFGGLD
jgi:hypothetical protein